MRCVQCVREVLCVRNLPQHFKPRQTPEWPVNETETDTYCVLSVSPKFCSLVSVAGGLPLKFGGEELTPVAVIRVPPVEDRLIDPRLVRW